MSTHCGFIVGAVYDRTVVVEAEKYARHRPRLQVPKRPAWKSGVFLVVVMVRMGMPHRRGHEPRHDRGRDHDCGGQDCLAAAPFALQHRTFGGSQDLPVPFRFLFNFKRNAKPLRKVSFRNSQIASDGSAGVEVLMEPEERRRYDGAGFPIHLYCFVVFQVALTCCSPDSLSTARPRRRSPSNDSCAR